MDRRTVEDRLREEYFSLLPDIRRASEELETEVRYCNADVIRALCAFEDEFEALSREGISMVRESAPHYATADFNTRCGCAMP